MGEMNQSDKTRLDRIEEKIDRMSEAVIALARAEEKIISLDETTRMILRKMVSQDERLRKVENTQHDNETTIKTIKSVVWTTISALITTAVATLAWLFTGSKWKLLNIILLKNHWHLLSGLLEVVKWRE